MIILSFPSPSSQSTILKSFISRIAVWCDTYWIVLTILPVKLLNSFMKVLISLFSMLFWTGLMLAQSVCARVFLSVCFPSGPLVVCLSTAAAAPGAAPLSCRSWPRGSASTSLRLAASGYSFRHRYRLGPAGTRCTGQPAPPACEGWEEPPWPGAQRWGRVHTLL